MIKHIILLVALVLLSGCNRDPLNPPPPKFPFSTATWHIGLAAPNYMEAWIESVDVVDRRGLAYVRVNGGVPSVTSPPNNEGNPRGWPEEPGSGKTKPMTNIDLPEIIFVRWQSLVEPRTYDVRIDIPPWVRDEMLTPHRAWCHWDGAYITDYRNVISVWVAPGGVARAWLMGPCLDAMDIGRFVGEIHEEGPNGGRTGGQYDPPSPNAQAWLEEHEIPYDSW
ncbi:MAG: DUF2931 family protein [Halopseudomonas sp.]|uniref:DUF2931 family protein n=1 Tax=Halopseudomonas sp. TaxID=2901191 RepID=UPI0030010E6D